MQPEQQANYDFIFNTNQQPNRRNNNQSMATRILVVVGIAFVVIILLGVVFRMVASNPSFDKSAMLAVAQQQTEILRLLEAGDDNSVLQSNKNFTVTAELAINSDQKALFTYLAERNYQPNPKELILRQDATASSQLEGAASTSTFDAAYEQVMETALKTYQQDLQNAYDSGGNSARELLKTQYDHSTLLLRQLTGDSVQAAAN